MVQGSSKQTALLKALLGEEMKVWDALVAGDMAADKKALHPDFLGVYPSGFSDREGHVNQLSDGATVVSYRLSETRVLELGPDCCCLSYLANFMRRGSVEEEAMYVSSIWKQQTNGWVNIFSQDTPKAAEAGP